MNYAMCAIPFAKVPMGLLQPLIKKIKQGGI